MVSSLLASLLSATLLISDASMRFIQCKTKTFGIFKMSTVINGNNIAHPCDIWSVLKKIKELEAEDFKKLLSLRKSYMQAEGQDKEEHMRRTGAVMLTLYLLKTGKIRKERKQIKQAIDFFTRHKASEGNLSHMFYVKASFAGDEDMASLSVLKSHFARSTCSETRGISTL